MLELAVRSQVDAALADEPADLIELGTRLLDRLSPPNWALEWSLPGWLGRALGLHASAIAALTLANVYGLAYVKLRDDLSDGEISEGDRPAALTLAMTFHRRWLLTYTGLFPGDSPFWSFFERYMAQWIAATLRSRQALGKPFRDYDEADLRGLGERGAPLMICAAAVCLLARQEGLIPSFEAMLGHLLTGAVLLDHALDWSDDLAAGRYNVFVAYASALPQTFAYKGANRRAVAEELMVGNAARPYFRLIGRELQVATDASCAAGVTGLTDYLIWLQSQASDYGRRLAQDSRTRLHALVGRILEPALAADIPVTPS